MNTRIALGSSLLLLALSQPSFAQGGASKEPRLMEAEYCFSVAGLKKEVEQFSSLKAHKRDRVGPMVQVRYEMEPGEVPPERLELRDGDGVEVFPMRQAGNRVISPNLVPQVVAASEATQICSVDPAREGRPVEAAGYEFDLGFNIRYLETPGTHSLADIEDGLKDGRSHWKKRVGAMGFMVPKFDHIAVAGDDADNPPVVIATAGDQDLGAVEGEFYDGARMVPLDALEEMGADGVRIEAANYRMTPSPDAKTVAKFAGG